MSSARIRWVCAEAFLIASASMLLSQSVASALAGAILLNTVAMWATIEALDQLEEVEEYEEEEAREEGQRWSTY